jgi:hypothetical protein
MCRHLRLNCAVKRPSVAFISHSHRTYIDLDGLLITHLCGSGLLGLVILLCLLFPDLGFFDHLDFYLLGTHLHTALHLVFEDQQSINSLLFVFGIKGEGRPRVRLVLKPHEIFPLHLRHQTCKRNALASCPKSCQTCYEVLITNDIPLLEAEKL